MSSDLECDYCGSRIAGRPITEGPNDFCSYACLEHYQDDTEES